MSVSHRIVSLLAVVSAALVYHEYADASETPRAEREYLTGSHLCKWWYQQLQHIVGILVPVSARHWRIRSEDTEHGIWEGMLFMFGMGLAF